MSETPAKRQDVDRLLVKVRWILFAVLFLFAYLASPQRDPASLRNLLILALAYNIIATVVAWRNIFPTHLPAATIGLDTLFIAALISISGKSESPFLLFLLVPAFVAGFRFQWRGGLAVAGIVAFLWLYLLLVSFASIPPSAQLVDIGAKLVLLLFIMIMAVSLGQAERLRARQREKDAEERFRLANEQIKAIYELTGNLSATLNYERVLEAVLDVGLMGLREIDRQIDQPKGMVLLFTDGSEGRKLHIAAYRRIADEDAQQLLPGEKGLLGQVMSSVEPAVINNPAADPELRALSSLHDCVSAAAIPLRAGFELYGSVLFASRRPNAYGKDQIAFLSTLCNQATIALQNAQLYEQLQEERDRIISSEEELRRRLARELHDGPTQTISALAMRLNYARLLLDKDPEKAREEIMDLERVARQATKEIRATLFTLRPVALETQGLRAALEQYALRLQETGGTPIRLDIEEPQDRLESNVESVVFSIVEEAVNNARKHAGADLITVRLATYDDLLVVTVQDNGHGFDVKAVESSYNQRGSLGLLNMRERAQLIGGTLEIESRPGHGTCVTLAVPLKSAV